jgi:hypothetical protein
LNGAFIFSNASACSIGRVASFGKFPKTRPHKEQLRSLAAHTFQTRMPANSRAQVIHEALYRQIVLYMTEYVPHRVMARLCNKTILVASRDPELADTRKLILEAAGYQIVPISDIRQVEHACAGPIHLIVIGYSLPPAEKRRIVHEARKHCKAPILELHEQEKAELADIYTHRSELPEDFLQTVNSILRPRRKT